MQKHVAWALARATIRFFRKAGQTHYEVVGKEGPLHVVHQPSPWSLTATFGERLKDIVGSLVA